MSKKLNKRQQIAANLIGLGHRPSEVATKLSITKETISRWRAQENFEIEVDQVTNALLDEMIDERISIIDTCQNVIKNIISDDAVSANVRGNIAMKYLHFVGARENAYDIIFRERRYLMNKYKNKNETSSSDETLDEHLKLLEIFS